MAGQDLGVLAVYAHQPCYSDQSVVDLGSVFVGYSPSVMENASLLDQTCHLKIAVNSHRRIGVAVGILMARNNLTEMQAFDLLRVTSQHTNTKLSVPVESVVKTETIRSLQS